MDLKNWVQVFVFLQVMIGIVGQNEICTFYGLEANCRYRIDAISLSHIRVEINQCADPVEVTFYIKNERPYVDFSHTFNRADTLVSVPRFMVRTQLRVRLTKKKDDVINIEADFFVYGQERADFINDDVKLRGLEDHCPLLNTAAKIAIGVTCGLTVLVAILIFSLLYIRYKRRKKRAAFAENQLVNNAAELGTSTPVSSLTNLNESHMGTSQVASLNSNNINGEQNASDSAVSDERRSLDDDRGNNASRNSVTSDKDNNRPDIRYSDILKNGNLKISDC
ncbi:uncharacterized protein LOC132740543 [Ruditapes philippinarum]|uniref:uncharacterized protein LOC132740543 n=1 Tax=Ruditapes philippinarum TaxID=129788 RepID=UPI00295B3F0B|nr:uncharacterized protein LOC132740543 [Ruditapes philippinarum]